MANDNDWLGWPERLVGVLTAVGGLLVFGRKWLVRAYRAVVLLLAFGEHWGEDAPRAIQRLLADISRAQGRGEVERRLFAEHIGLALYICDPSGSCTAANDPLCELFGLDSSGFVGFGWLECLEERLEIYQDWIRCVTNGLPYHQAYTVVNQRTGERNKCETRAYAVTAADGTVVCYVGYVERVEE